MVATSHESLWLELRRRGLIGRSLPEPLGGGNRDRADPSRSVFKVDLPDSSPAKITLGNHLGDVASRATAFAKTFPSLRKPPLFFHEQIAGIDVLGEHFFEGFSLRKAVSRRSLPSAVIHSAFLRAISDLQSAGTPSNEVSRASEWASWCEQICSLGIWKASDLSFLQDRLLPALASQLFVGSAETRWVHGDFTDENLLLNAKGESYLIDTEFARQTHFFPVEAAHFYALSPSANQQPGLFEGAFARPSPAWFIHFWLTQIAREVAVNTPEYVARWTPARLAVIGQLSAAAYGRELNSPWPSTSEEVTAARETIQIFWTNSENAIWTESASRRLTYLTETTQTVFFPVDGHSSSWRIDPSASQTATRIHRLTAYSKDHIEIGSVTGPQITRGEISPLGDTHIQSHPSGALIQAPSGDPQFVCQFSGDMSRPNVAWLEIELSTVPSSDEKADSSRSACHIEEGRWLDLSPTFFRAGGWYYPDPYVGVSKFHAVLLGQIIASSAALPRPDVQNHFKGDPRALMTGFELDLPAWAAGHTAELTVQFENGSENLFHSISVPRAPKRPLLTEDYPAWAQTHDPDPVTSAVILTPAITFSILLPVYNPNPTFLEACLLSVQKQHFPQWELCIVDDASDESINHILQRGSLRADPRVKVTRRTTNGGIARATNDALSAATGRYIVLLDHDDILRPHALAEFASLLGREPDLDAIYSDEDKIDSAGIRRVPFLKPDHSPEFVLGVMFVGHALCVRTDVARSLGGFDSTYDGVQDYEFFLRLMERTSRIGHIPRMLYHWRMSPSSSAMTGNVKGNMDALQVRAVQAHLARTGRHAVAVSLGGHRVRLEPTQARGSNDCTFLVAAGIQTAALGSCPIVVVNPFDRSGLLDAIQQVTTRFVAIVTNKLKPEKPDWLEQLLAFADAEDVGAVGPVLLNTGSTIASAGVLLTNTGNCVPLMRDFASDGEGYHGSLICTREVLAMASDCVVVRRETLVSVANTVTAFPSDEWAVDLCLTLRSRGKRNLICANARLQSTPEAGSEPATQNTGTPGQLFSKWRRTFESRDPYYPAAFDRKRGDYLLRTDRTSESLSDSLHVYIDVPAGFELRGGYLRMRGWCYSPQFMFQQVRIVLKETAIFGRYGTHRPDVPKIFPEAPGADIGFELWAIIPRGNHSVSLEFQDSERTWHRATVLDITAHPSSPLWFPSALPEDLVHFQLGARPSHAPRPVTDETFPAAKAPSNPLRFSIVTPSYNQCRYLAETIHSVLSQEQIDLEYVVQDGGSTDGSVELISSKASQLKHWESAKDQGQADAIARGFTATSGRPDDVMAWLNSDDAYAPHALAYVAAYFAAHPDVDVVYGHRILIDEDSREIGRWLLPPHDGEMLKMNDYVPQETLFWRRRIWDKVGGIDTSFKFAMDWDLLLRFQEAGAKIVRVPYFLACFRIHAAQKTSAQMESVGQKEIDALRLRTLGRVPAPEEIETNPRLIRYLRKSAWIEFLWRRFRIRHP